ncbi:inosine/guanosine kinase, partial [Vibrio parahaemolyticus]|nr:inosine/guanosine kinase [Vibrio parahaemolyticus]
LQLLPGSSAELNRYEFSRPAKKDAGQYPIRVYSHIYPYMGGPEKIKNTNGAVDAALSAFLHDIAANKYHKENVPNS